MNREHARPIVAFACVAAAAAVVIGAGLRAEAPQVQVRAGSPSAVQPTVGEPGLVLGSSLTARPTASATTAPPGSFSTVVQNYATMFATLSGLLDEVAVRRAPVVAGPQAPVPTDTKDVAEARATATSSPSAPADTGTDFPGRGKGSDNASGNASENAGGKGPGGNGQSAPGKGKG